MLVVECMKPNKLRHHLNTFSGTFYSREKSELIRYQMHDDFTLLSFEPSVSQGKPVDISDLNLKVGAIGVVFLRKL